MYLLDTDHAGILQEQTRPEFDILWPRIAAVGLEHFFISIITFHEQVIGWNGYISCAKNSAGVVRGYSMFQRELDEFSKARVVAFDDAAAAMFQTLRSGRVRVPTMDLRIAAIALCHDFTVLTRNTVHFGKVPGLKFADWTI